MVQVSDSDRKIHLINRQKKFVITGSSLISAGVIYLATVGVTNIYTDALGAGNKWSEFNTFERFEAGFTRASSLGGGIIFSTGVSVLVVGLLVDPYL